MVATIMCSFLPYTFSSINDSMKKEFGITELEMYWVNQAAIISLLPATFVANYVL
jgi:hypothetical protein